MNRILLKILIITAMTGGACSTGSMKHQLPSEEERTILNTNEDGKGPQIIVEFKKGESFYYPLFAIWLEDQSGNYLQTLYVAKSVATGFFEYAVQEGNRWKSGYRRAPQTLPYWAHKRGIQASDGLYVPDKSSSVPDAYSGATPVRGFVLNSRADGPLPRKFRVMLEVNQNWDWNDYWTNDKFPDDKNYLMSCQPAVIYETLVDMENRGASYTMKAIGHSHYSGQTGELFNDLSTLTTALKIAASVSVTVKD